MNYGHYSGTRGKSQIIVPIGFVKTDKNGENSEELLAKTASVVYNDLD